MRHVAVAVGVLAMAIAVALASASLYRSPARTRSVPAPSFVSRALRGRERFAIALPPGYGSSRRRYPLVVLLHGLPDDGTAYRDPRVARLAAVAAAHAHPDIVVAPQGARSGRPDDEWHDWGPGRNWETAVAHELVLYVDAHWRTIPDRRSRAIIGVSAGGYGATIIGLHHPNTFSVIESWSGYFHPTTPKGDALLDVGSNEDDRIADAHRFVGCLSRLPPTVRPRFFGFYVGADDSYADFVADNRRLDQELTAAGVPHRFALYPGGHSGAFWAAHEEHWLMAAVAHLASAPPPRPGDERPAAVAAHRAGCPGA
jgi:putative tributyrin esterase